MSEGGSVQSTRVTITESSLRQIAWEARQGTNLDGSPWWFVAGTWPDGEIAFMLPLPVDEVTP